MKRMIAFLIAIAMVVSLTACQQKAEMSSAKNITVASISESAQFADKDKQGSALETDVVRLGSPIHIEETVTYGWDAPGQKCSVSELIPAAVEAAGVEDGMLQVDAIRLINAYLYNRTVYKDGGRYCRTVYGALYLHACVCVGFTMAFMYMCQYCGIDAVYVHGYVGGVGHAWNGVYFSDGTYLEVDTCFNKTSAYIEKYLLLTPEEMTALGGHIRCP